MSKKENILHWLGFAKLLLPTALIAAGVEPSKVHGLTEAITTAETEFGPGTGREKLDAVVKGVIGGMETKGVAPATIESTKKMLEHGVTSAVTLVNDIHDLHDTHVAEAVKQAATTTAAGAIGGAVAAVTEAASTDETPQT